MVLSDGKYFSATLFVKKVTKTFIGTELMGKKPFLTAFFEFTMIVVATDVPDRI
jgi:hypothetical protein